MMEKIEANDTIIWAKEEKELRDLREAIGYDFITVIEKRAGYQFIIVDELPSVEKMKTGEIYLKKSTGAYCVISPEIKVVCDELDKTLIIDDIEQNKEKLLQITSERKHTYHY